MKTAQSIVDNDIAHLLTYRHRLINAVKQIQLDAYKAGMTRAANIIPPPSPYARKDCEWNDGYCEAAIAKNKAILTERDNLKELPAQ